ncbi:MAG: DUF3160 domain-containing protein [Oscillochloridaceae bacterium]|nr:DUF3160 domain-containing protein [Chloroflexaceae bacterium]MDW8390865.1 DUF3160 domain-containing protein [Oscillochloridaceae bacterium]
MKPSRALALASLVLLMLLPACVPRQAAPTPAAGEPTAVVAPTMVIVPTPIAGLSVSALQLPAVALPAGFRPAEGSGFAPFQPPPVRVEARVRAEPVAADLSNVILSVPLSPEQRARVAANGFVVSPGETKEFYELYERARYDNIPVFVTSDSLLHVYHLLFDRTLRRAEMTAFIPMLKRLNAELLRTSVAQYEALAGTPWADAARRNAAYFAVALKLLDPDWEIPAGLRDLAEPDLAAIAAHNRIGPSAIFPGYPRGEDWSQYVPRGHYTKNEDLKRYFRAMMWHGRMTFRANDTLETQQAALLTLAYQQTSVDGLPANQVWAGIYEPTVFFVGRSDDLTPREYGEALAAAYGPVSDPRDLLDPAKFAAFQAAVKELRPPQIMGMVVIPGTTEELVKGLRLMGQRFVPDAFVFQKLIIPNVPDRTLPRSLDFFAAIGSDRALRHLENLGDTALPKYRANMDALRAAFASYDEATWTQNLYWSWIHSLRPLLEPAGEGYPAFMRSEAWLDKQLTTALGSWTELKRDTILYAKQVYVERGYDALEPPEPERAKGYVEPVPELFARVAGLSRMTIEGLAARGLLAEEDRALLEAMESLATRLKIMAEKQLRGEALSDEEYELIRFYGAEIEALTFAADDEAFYQGRGGTPAGGEDLQAAVVADIATNGVEGVVLENAVGRVFEIFVVAPIEGRLVLTKGGVFSHYEFVQPLSDRLTDEAWRARLDAGEAPPLAAWTESFMVAANAAEPLATTIRRFNERLVEAIWYTDAERVAEYLGPEELADTRAYIASLERAGQFVGSKLLMLQFRSFDFVDADNAIVTTRESWSDELYRGSPYFEDQLQQGEPVRIGVRAPYTLDVTYTLRREGEGWRITRIVLDPPEPPAWQAP